MAAVVTSQGVKFICLGPWSPRCPPVNRGDIRGLACTHKIVFYTQVTPLRVEMGVLRLSHWCLLSGRKRENGLTQEITGDINRGRLLLFPGVCLKQWFSVLAATGIS